MSHSEFDLGSVESEMHVELPKWSEEMEPQEPLESSSSWESSPLSARNPGCGIYNWP